MNLIGFLKFDWRKIIITFLLLASGFLYVRKVSVNSINLFFYGFPLAYFLEIITESPIIAVFQESQVFNAVIIGGLFFGLLADIGFWYLSSCAIVWIFKKFKK